MSALFYVWDAEQHHPQTTTSTLEQAEHFATNPQDLGFTEKLKNWLIEIESIVTNPELVENFDEEIIQFFTSVKGFFNFSTNVFVIEYLQEKSKYLYKILVETLRKHNLVAFDAKYYVFFSRDVIFPDQKSIEQMLDAVQTVTKEKLLKFESVPANNDKLIVFAKEWIENHRNDVHFFHTKKKNIFNELSYGFYREISPELYQSIFILTPTNGNKLAYTQVVLINYIQLKSGANLYLKRDHYIDGYTLQYLSDIHGVKGEANHLENSAQLQHVLQQIYDFLIYDEEKHKTDLQILNQWVNHGDEKQYITGLAVISRLVLAKYVNDPLYNQLVAEALPYVSRGEGSFRKATLEQFHERLEKEIKNILEK
jgi:hypothetical protein